MSREGNIEVAAVGVGVSRLDGMGAHVRTGDDRLHKYVPGQIFRLKP